RDVDRDFDARDAALEALEIGLDLRAARGRNRAAAAVQIAAKRLERAGVVLELEVRLPEVVEHLVVGRRVVRALELDQRGAEIALAKELDAALEVRARLIFGIGVRRDRN